MLTSMVACRGLLKKLTFVSETSENTLWAMLVACNISTARYMTCPNIFHRKLLFRGERKKVIRSMVCEILH